MTLVLGHLQDSSHRLLTQVICMHDEKVA